MSSRFPAAPAKAYGVGGEDHKTSASSEDPGTPRIISWEKSDTGGKELRKGTSGSQARPKSSHTDRSSMATIQDDDERMLAMIGYKQEMKREFNKLSTISYAISILGVLGSVPATFDVPIKSGGPATAVWCWFIGSFMAMCIASSVSELVSAYPTAGGMYFVTKHVVPAKHIPIWSWIVGWCNFLGQTAGVSSLAWTISQMILACASMNSTLDGENYAFVPTAHQTVLLAIGVLCVVGVVCSLTTKTLHRIIMWFAPVNVIASCAICAALLILTPEKKSAAWVFTEFTDGSGWGSKAFSFLLGFLSVAWTMTDYDGTTHMSEETHDAAIRGPIAINLAIVVSGIVGWMLTITFCFCMGDFGKTVKTPTKMIVAQIFLNAGGRTGGTIMWFFVILIQTFTICTAMLADTRMAYAFARDGAFPFSGFWSKINPHTHTPVNAVWLVVLCCISMDLIALGSTETVFAIFSITAPALDLSYIAVIIARRWYEFRGEIRFIEGPYTLGRYGKPVNLVAVAWVCFISVVLFFPPSKPVTAANMNYAIAVAGGIALFALGWWWAGARKTYTGPKTKNLMERIPSDEAGQGEYVDEDVGDQNDDNRMYEEIGEA